MSGDGLEVFSAPVSTAGLAFVPTGTGAFWVIAGVEQAAAQVLPPVPTGTGFAHTTGGVLDAASKLVVNADVNAAAAIAGTKISPDFGAQTVKTTGFLSVGTAPTGTQGVIRLGNNQAMYGTNAVGSDVALVFCGPGATNTVVFGDNAQANTDVTGANVTSLSENSGEHLRVEAAGVSIGGTTGSYGTGTRVIFIRECAVAPTTDPVGGGIMYVEGGALKYRGTGGTVTVLAPA